MSAKEIMKQKLEAELAELNAKIEAFTNDHDDINGFIHNCETLRKMKQRRQGVQNALNSSVFA